MNKRGQFDCNRRFISGGRQSDYPSIWTPTQDEETETAFEQIRTRKRSLFSVRLKRLCYFKSKSNRLLIMVINSK